MSDFNTPSQTIRLAGAPDSWGVWFPEDAKQPAWSDFLDEVALAGYSAIELGPWGYLPTDPAVLRKELDARALELAGVTVIRPFDDLADRSALDAEVRAACELGSEFGVEHLVLIEQPYTIQVDGSGVRSLPIADSDQWKRMTDTITRVGLWVKEEWGMTAVFHSHADSFVESESEIERLLADVPEQAMQLCIDTGHHLYGGGDPVTFFQKHADRVAHLHLKDVNRALVDQTKEAVEDFAAAVIAGAMVEPGRGVIDFRAFREILAEADWSGWAVVEQDMYPAPAGQALPIARRTISHLLEAGFSR